MQSGANPQMYEQWENRLFVHHGGENCCCRSLPFCASPFSLPLTLCARGGRRIRARRWPFGKMDGSGKWNKPHLNQGPLFFKQTNQKGHLLWMDKILHHLETMGNHCLLGICRGTIIPGFLRWCEMDFAHPQYGRAPNTTLPLSWLSTSAGCRELSTRAGSCAVYLEWSDPKRSDRSTSQASIC